jgi:cytochrome c-type biogenesis protein
MQSRGSNVMIEEIKYSAAFLAGLFSFFSPCILPLVPSYFSFITGVSMEDLSRAAETGSRRKVMASTLAFVLGFSLIFIALGATAAYFSVLLQEAKDYIRIAGGVLIIVLGLHLLGILRIRALEHEKRVHLNRKPVHFLGAFLIGMAFAAGWSPCIGPLLGSILILAGNQDTVSQGVWLLTLFSAGVALPFIVLSAAIQFLIRFVRRAARAMRWINMGAGILLIATGLLLVSDRLQLLSYFAF